MAHYTLCLSAEYQGQVVGERKKKKKRKGRKKIRQFCPWVSKEMPDPLTILNLLYIVLEARTYYQKRIMSLR